MTPLPDGGTVGVIGAGPAGTFFALHFLTLLKESGRAAGITLFDRKTFECSGPSGCNMCAGAIGGEMVNKIKRLGLTLDESVIRRVLDGAVARGAEFVHERVESVRRIPAGFRVATADGQTRKFDFLVGAFGVNSVITRMMAMGYVPPRTWHTVQAELPAENKFIVDRLRNRIHIVPARGKAIRFLAITPKDNFLTLTGIGEHVRIAFPRAG